MESSRVVHLTDDTFDEAIKNANGPVLVDFWAAWCGPCKAIAPSLEQLASEMAGQVTIAKVNVDDNGDLSSRFGIRNIPTLLVFKDGRLVDQTIGAQPKESLRGLIRRHLATASQ